MKDVYIYPAVLEYEESGISIFFPDLPGCLPCAKDTEEAIRHAREALALHIYGMERDGDDIPEASKPLAIEAPENGTVILVDAFMPTIRERQSNRFTKKTLSIPAWLNAEAERKGVNFSQILQKALKEYLQIH